MKPENINLGEIFFFCDIRSKELETILRKVLSTILDFVEIDDLMLGYLHEGRTSSGEVAEVTEDGFIYLDFNKLKDLPEDIIMAIIAHEFAHYYLEHYNSKPKRLEFKEEADNLAKKWGFDIDKFRKVCGPATIKLNPLAQPDP
jgi:hypothetical protein